MVYIRWTSTSEYGVLRLNGKQISQASRKPLQSIIIIPSLEGALIFHIRFSEINPKYSLIVMLPAEKFLQLNK